MAEVPEHLLRRSRERREALGAAPSGGGGGAGEGGADASPPAGDDDGEKIPAHLLGGEGGAAPASAPPAPAAPRAAAATAVAVEAASVARAPDQHPHVVAPLGQLLGQMAAEKPRCARDEDGHGLILTPTSAIWRFCVSIPATRLRHWR